MFNKKRFAELLKRAIGERTTTAYADIAGVNRTYISKLLNEKLPNPPSPDIIKGLASAAYGGVTYEDFMRAAGHFSATTLAYNEAMSLLDEIEREIQIAKEKGITIDRATAQKIVEHRRRILAGDEGSIDYIYQAETLGDALLRVAELDYEYDFDEETFAKLVIKAREKYGLPSVKGAEPVAHSTNYHGANISKEGDRCVHEDSLEYDPVPIQQEPTYEKQVLSAGTLADASIKIAYLLNTKHIDGEEYLRLNTLAYKKYGLPPAPGAEQAAHTEQNIPGTGVFEEDTKKR